MNTRMLAVVAAGEAGTGFALLLAPSIVVSLLFGTEVIGAGVTMSRITGSALVALAVACWPGAGSSQGTRAAGALLIYSILACACLVHAGLTGSKGLLLWPATALHMALVIVFAVALLRPDSKR